MPFLPIAERELRVAAHQRRTWLRRVLLSAGALVLFAFLYVAMRRLANAAWMGGQLFKMLAWSGMVHCLLAGPLATIDCLSRERREGTLGLLFLTDLRTYDIVFGKLAAASLDVLFSLAAALPVIALPLLMGGVSLIQFAWVSVSLINIMFMSLAIGICASAFFASGRAALVATLLALMLLTFGLPWFGEQVLHLPPRSRLGLWFYSACPFYSMICALGLAGLGGVTAWNTWTGLTGLQILSWACLLGACLRTKNVWRELPASRVRLRWTAWNERFERWTRGSARCRRAWCAAMLDRNPIAWLEGRRRMQTIILWGLVLITSGFWLEQHFLSSWPEDYLLILWPLVAHYLLCVWIAIQAPRRLGDDKQSGALELLLCTPLSPARIVEGAMLMVRRRFGWAFLGMMLLDAYMFWVRAERRDFGTEQMMLGLCALIVFPIQTYAFARIGLYQGLTETNSLRATFLLIAKAGLLPWGVFFGFLFTWDEVHRKTGLLRSIDDVIGFGSWITAHVLVCAAFLAQANRQLRRHFRVLAATSTRRSWWGGAGPES